MVSLLRLHLLFSRSVLVTSSSPLGKYFECQKQHRISSALRMFRLEKWNRIACRCHVLSENLSIDTEFQLGTIPTPELPLPPLIMFASSTCLLAVSWALAKQSKALDLVILYSLT
jgi:hypothetical protein